MSTLRSFLAAAATLMATAPPSVTMADIRSTPRLVGDDLNKEPPDMRTLHLNEEDRINEYHRRNYTWPLQQYNPDTPGWKALMEGRFRQVEEMDDRGQRYEGFLQTMQSAFLAPNFTEHGFGLARCPDDLLQALQQGIRDGIPTADLEPTVDVIDGPLQPWLIKRPDLTDRVLQELRHYAETWAQTPLTAFTAYGFRLYRNESHLYMHRDRMRTHIVSFILHIDSADDAEPWPIFIEDFHGNTHEVVLTPGDMLFYESSKCFHGRPKPLQGSWYSSVFVHYYPAQGWTDLNHELEAHYTVPPHWKATAPPPEQRREPRLKMIGGSMHEPECEYGWCRARDSIKWSGPGKTGVWIDPQQNEHPFHPQLGEFDHDEL